MDTFVETEQRVRGVCQSIGEISSCHLMCSRYKQLSVPVTKESDKWLYLSFNYSLTEQADVSLKTLLLDPKFQSTSLI